MCLLAGGQRLAIEQSTELFQEGGGELVFKLCALSGCGCSGLSVALLVLKVAHSPLALCLPDVLGRGKGTWESADREGLKQVSLVLNRRKVPSAGQGDCPGDQGQAMAWWTCFGRKGEGNGNRRRRGACSQTMGAAARAAVAVVAIGSAAAVVVAVVGIPR